MGTPKDATLLLPTPEPTPEEYGPWHLAGEVGRARSQIGGEAFVCKKTGSCAVPPGPASTSGEVCQENAFTRACRLPGLPDRLSALCEAQSNVWQKAAKGNRTRWVSVVRRLLPQPSSPEHQPILLGPMRWVDVAGRALRRSWTAHWQRQYVEVLPLPQQALPKTKPPPRPPRAVRSRHRWSWQARLNCNAWWAPHKCVSVWQVFLHVSPATNTGGM